MAQPAFVPRSSFDVPANITRSYYLGHHAAALRQISTKLVDTSLVIECRDFRVPLTSWNPLLERTLVGPQRIVVYTKLDLGTDSKGARAALKELHRSRPGESAVFVGMGNKRRDLIEQIRDAARQVDSITGVRTFVVGMPNVGKSTILNMLRVQGMGAKSAKVAITGNHPGVTRNLSNAVRILGGKNDPDQTLGEGVFVSDTPGIFVPYVPDGESMVKLALVHGIKDNIVPHEIVVDYLLYRLNKWDPALYSKYSPPTNEVSEMLHAVAKKTGKYGKSPAGFPIQAAMWIIEQWRHGKLGRYVLDDVSPAALQAKKEDLTTETLSMNQARKREKETRKKRNEEKRKG
ncbi:MAG: 50S ribosome-binding GTPase [Acidobacteria bacterium]|nr:50S ribosome-binding GTPase [Acidobacteriota bacterium]